MTDRSDFPIVRFSTDDLPEKDRDAAWRLHFAPLVLNSEIEPPPANTTLKARMALRSLPGLRVSSGLYAPGRQIRTRRLIAEDGVDDYSLSVNTSGVLIVSSAGKEVHYNGGAVLTSVAEVSTWDLTTFGGTTAVRIPRSILSPLVTGIDSVVMRPISAQSNILKLLVSYANALLIDDTLVSTHELRHLAVNHVTDLVALTLGATRDAAYHAEGRGIPAARLHAAKAYVMANSSRQNLSVADVAKHLGVSSRHVQRLFDSEGTTFSAFLLNHRLACAYRMLCEPRYGHWDIGTIGYNVGFNDASHFGRCFRNAYGSTPGDIRRVHPGFKHFK
jgi:AraC-like DNA-binding protein